MIIMQLLLSSGTTTSAVGMSDVHGGGGGGFVGVKEAILLFSIMSIRCHLYPQARDTTVSMSSV